jgi:hypothetical protein
MGDKVLASLSKNAEKIGISRNVFNMVNEGFWDLYFKRPIPAANLKSDALKEWFTKINLSLPRGEPAEDGE